MTEIFQSNWGKYQVSDGTSKQRVKSRGNPSFLGKIGQRGSHFPQAQPEESPGKAIANRRTIGPDRRYNRNP
ncbi:hypothetical protein NG796_19025 [Laspinema sp. A4]|uniref:hypothetical protein n=1 Tax=Laspinema sp. D2d TaxID=2953686 RepID=UPI0021BAAF1C|nr:hypothetical protein [Laspinema sp. D2d]MCT7985370.1 hypothetical protein [Laspinema sp. D2d]